MFLGHYGVALALKRAEPKLSLGTLFVAVQLADLISSGADPDPAPRASDPAT